MKEGDSIERVMRALAKWGLEHRIMHLEESTSTSEQAARALGVELGQIAKSLVFLSGQSPVLVIASGSHRVSEAKLSSHLGEGVKKATAAQVKDLTGFAIGGVPPLGHSVEMKVFIDRDLMAYEEIYAAAGSPHSVMRLTPMELVEITGGELVDVRA